jgi:hypothetical protein
MDTRTDSTVPRPVSVGPEMEALGRFYQDVTWKGVIHEGGMGTGPRLRFTWDASGPGVITWRNEMAAADGSWFLIEEYEMVPV